ncbi:TIGR04326 family surface carbohydrate biosynthesis protein, partial [Nitratidesulfovibrio liaohensis]|uniref:TIGR04326 family surface carbohydrate biosynthesis protein n=1 Tax=Nitratidesulfovibrio liaohensis TaxID=2604158 RepID=UPI0014217582
WLLREKRLLPAAPEATGKASLPAHPRPGTVATYFPNIDVQAAKQGRLRSRYWESLHDALDPQQGGVHGVTWLFIFEPTPHYSLADAIRLRDEFRARKQDGIAFHFIEEFLTPATIAREVLHYCRMALRAARLTRHVAGQCRLPGSRMDFWPYMARNWAESTRGWLGLQRRLMRAAFRRYAAVCAPQEWTIFPMENHPWEKSLAHAMHEARRGPVYGTQHSTVRPTDLRYYEDARAFAEPDAAATLPDLMCCNGQGALGHMRDAGMPAERLGEIEALRYLYLADAASGAAQGAVSGTTAATAPPSGDASAPAPSATPVRPTLLIVTSFFIDETDNQLDVLAEAARAGTLDGYNVVVKPHPNLPVEGRLAARFPSGGAPRVVNTPVAQLLVPGTIVWAANSTTVALEAAYQRLPLIVQTAANDFNMCPLLGVPGTAFVATADDLAAALAHPAPPDLPPGFLALDCGLPRWRRLLGIPEK